MRTVEARMIQAIRTAMADSHRDGRIMKSGNTEVNQLHHGIAHTPGYHREVEVLLHGNQIAVLEPDLMRIRLSDCGWQTVTTKSRLNALLRAFVSGEGISQQNWQWFTTEGPWEGEDEWPVRLESDNWVLQQAERLAG